MTEKSNVKVELAGPYWLTRDKRDGILSSKIEVWLVRPELHSSHNGDVMWLPSLGLSPEDASVYAEWTVAECLKRIYTYPATERECLCHG